MNDHIKKVQQAIEPLRQQIINHKVYALIKGIDDLGVFMNYHIYAVVWDFASAVKGLTKQFNLYQCAMVPGRFSKHQVFN